MVDLKQLSEEAPNLKIEASIGELIEAVRKVLTEVIERFQKAEQAKQPEEYLTRKQAAKMLGVAPNTLWRWAEQNYLSAVPVGGKRYYKRSDIDNLLQGKDEA